MNSLGQSVFYVVVCWAVPIAWGAAVHYLFEYGVRARSSPAAAAKTPRASVEAAAARAEAVDDALIESHL